MSTDTRVFVRAFILPVVTLGIAIVVLGVTGATVAATVAGCFVLPVAAFGMWRALSAYAATRTWN